MIDILVLENGAERTGTQVEIDADEIYHCDDCGFYHETPTQGIHDHENQ